MNPFDPGAPVQEAALHVRVEEVHAGEVTLAVVWVTDTGTTVACTQRAWLKPGDSVHIQDVAFDMKVRKT